MTRALAAARAHPGLLAVLFAGALVRLAVALAYEPGLLFSDSWSYVRLAFDPGFANDRPSGYPALVWILWLPGRSLLTLTTIQHLAGLASAGLAYAILWRLGAGALPATLVAALVALDGYAIALEQFVMAESLFTFAVLLATYLATTGEPTGRRVAAAGLVLGGAVTLRTLGLFAVPAFLVYALWRYPRWRLPAVALVTVLAPILAYSSLHAAAGKGFGMTQIDGWALYSRVAPFADCERAATPIPSDLRSLCQPASARRDEPSYYGWSPESPANLLFGDRKIEGNERLREFARPIALGQPLDYARAVGSDFLRFFRPTSEGGEGAAPGGFDEPIVLPAPGEGQFESDFATSVRDEALPGYRREIDAPQGAARALTRTIHTSRPLMAVATLAAIAALLAAALSRGGIAIPRRKEILFLTGAGLLMLLGAASVEFQLRYLVPSAPLLLIGGALACVDLGRAMRGQGGSPAAGPVTVQPRQADRDAAAR